MSLFKQFIGRYLKNIIPYVIFSSLGQILVLYIVTITGNCTNLLIGGNRGQLKETVIWLMIGVVASIVILPLFRLIQMKNFIDLGFSFDEWFYGNFINGEKSLIDRYNKGVLLDRIFMDPILYRADVIQVIGTGVIFIIVFIASFSVMAKINLIFAIFCVFLSLSPMTLNFYVANKLRNVDMNTRNINNEITSREKEIIDNFFFIKAQSLEDRALVSFKNLYRDFMKLLRKKLHLEEGLKSFNQWYGTLCNITIYIIGAVFIGKGYINIGEAVKFIGVSLILKDNTINLNASVKSFMSLRNSTNRLCELLKEEINGEKSINKIETLEIENLSFCYGNNLILKDINLHIKEGDKLLLKGANGSGKTTLCKLVLGLYKEYTGVIRINGERLANINLRDLRRVIYMCEQIPFIFNDTVYNNIKICCNEENHSKINETLKLLGIYNMKDKVAGEKGCLLSGGEVQRIAIARTMLTNADFIILDEPNNNLDNDTRKIIRDYFNNLHKTIIIISHDIQWEDNQWNSFQVLSEI